jgi:phosphatidylserine/phosphatidylglycerophosphate/cardiolipin synthase-like enzyme
MGEPFSSWLLEGGEAIVSVSRSIQTRYGNEVTAFIEIRDYYQYLAEAIAATQGGRAHFIFISAWGFDPQTPLDPPIDGQSTIGDLLLKKSREQVPVRALIWAHPDGSRIPAVKWFGSLPTGGAIHDDRVLVGGCHHQKFVIVRGSEGVVGFCGGMDIAANRLKDGPLGRPWHDVQVRIKGEAAIDLWSTFYHRWIEQDSLSYGARGVNQPLYPAIQAPSNYGKCIQIVRTFGNGAQHLGLNMRKVPSSELIVSGPFRQQSRVYQFAPSGERTIHRLLIKAIRATRKSIYLEDQYLIASEQIQNEPSLMTELSKAMDQKSFQGMVILTNGVGTIQGELCQVNSRRLHLWNQLLQPTKPAPDAPWGDFFEYERKSAGMGDPKKLSVWAFKGSQTSPYWMHSKTWVFDDTLAVIGSANCNRRGYCHDSEIAAVVLDPFTKTLPFAQDLRIRLWLKHLNSRKQRVNQTDIFDFANGMKFWADNNDTDLVRLNLGVADAYHPDGSLLDPTVAAPAAGSWGAFFRELDREFKTVRPKDWRDFEWDTFIDPDGS